MKSNAILFKWNPRYRTYTKHRVLSSHDGWMRYVWRGKSGLRAGKFESVSKEDFPRMRQLSDGHFWWFSCTATWLVMNGGGVNTGGAI
jgi:hypothetical protein